ncbi:MAG: hypothetical protein J5966_04200 [Lachnospiraceae bacterium]|nr:hypothetical protein [Lachnospiraceae bacterium]
MEIVQLGLFSKVFNWVYDKILDPMWDWVSDLLASGFKYLADIIPDAVGVVMDSILGDVINMILEWYYSKWFLLQSAILLLLDCIEDCFNVVSGLSPVYLSSNGAPTGEGVPMLFAVFRQGTVQHAFFAMIVVGFSICFFMAIIATARSFFELAGETTKPVTHIIRMTAKSLLYLMLAPLISFALILMSQAILKTMDRALTAGDEGRTSIARVVFCIASLDAVDTDKHSDGKEYNISYSEGPSKASLTDKYREPFYHVDANAAVPNFTNPDAVKKTFTFRGFDYFVGIGCGIFFTVVMCMVLSVFIGRIFDVVVLLIIQPFFVGLMPFDDGEYYRRWFELFLGKLFQGFGSVIAMRVYLMLLEQLFSGNIRFSNSTSLGARIQDYLMMLLFAMGGAVAVRHIGPLVTGILSQSAATGEQMSAAAGWAAGQKIAGRETKVIAYPFKYAAGTVGNMMGKSFSSSGRGGAFTGAGRGGSVAGGSGAGAGSAGGANNSAGSFGARSRPGNTGAVPGGGQLSGGTKSKAQQSLANYRTSAYVGANNYRTSGADSGRRREKDQNTGVSMQDILGSGAGQEIELQDLSGRSGDEGGAFSGGNKSGISMQDILGSGAGQEIELQDLSGRSGDEGEAFSGGNKSDLSMQDIVGQGSGFSGTDNDDPLNTGFYDPDTGGDDDK